MLGKVLIVANPTARSGKAAEAAAQAVTVLERMRGNADAGIQRIDTHYTVAPHDATSALEQKGADYDTVIAIGGDGIVNESVNGLMRLAREARPQLALVPCGNGDDFARSIRMNRKPAKALQQLESLALQRQTIDVGSVNDTWFAQTVSFGLDAAIALGTQKLRKETSRTGTQLYIQCAIDQLTNHRTPHACSISLDGGAPVETHAYLLAVQNGPSYGGGFNICPDADLSDGMLDLCLAEPELTAPAALKLLAQAKNGKHTKHKNLRFFQAKNVEVLFEHVVPAQADGEDITGSEFHIQLHPQELRVLVAR